MTGLSGQLAPKSGKVFGHGHLVVLSRLTPPTLLVVLEISTLIKE